MKRNKIQALSFALIFVFSLHGASPMESHAVGMKAGAADEEGQLQKMSAVTDAEIIEAIMQQKDETINRILQECELTDEQKAILEFGYIAGVRDLLQLVVIQQILQKSQHQMIEDKEATDEKK